MNRRNCCLVSLCYSKIQLTTEGGCHRGRWRALIEAAFYFIIEILLANFTKFTSFIYFLATYLSPKLMKMMKS